MLTILISVFNNNNLHGLKLWSFTNSSTNIGLNICIFIIIYKKWARYCITSFTGICANQNTLLPLSNTFFLIHPPLLTLGVALITLALSRKSVKAWPAVWCFSVAIFLGGFWSFQELNWGGWWNWDVLELGSLILWVFGMYALHFKQGLRRDKYLLIVFYWLILSFYILNKTGVGTSIHAFVTSNVLKTNFLLIILIMLIFIYISKISIYVYLIALIVYVSLLDARVLKNIATVIIFWYIVPRKWQKINHLIILVLIIGILIFNYTNILFNNTGVYNSRFYTISSGNRLVLITNNYNWLWAQGWRLKPQHYMNFSLVNFQTRSLSAKTWWLAYAK